MLDLKYFISYLIKISINSEIFEFIENDHTIGAQLKKNKKISNIYISFPEPNIKIYYFIKKIY